MRFVSGGSLAVAVALLAAACSSGDDGGAAVASTPSSSSAGAPSGDAVVVENQGGSIEGHTPRGFAGMGTGLFVGDNLNPGFPDGDGVQLFVTFELPGGLEGTEIVTLRSDSFEVRGDPFGDLGELSVVPVTYSEFGPHLFDLEPDDEAVGCGRVGDSSIECDVTTAVAGSVAAGDTSVQFRLRFDLAGDNDGDPDLVMFNRGDSNTNEAGIFTLEFG